MEGNANIHIKGAAMVEYVLIIGFLVSLAVISIPAVGTTLANFFTSLSTIVSNL